MYTEFFDLDLCDMAWVDPIFVLEVVWVDTLLGIDEYMKINNTGLGDK